MHGVRDSLNPLNSGLVFASDQPGEKYQILSTGEIIGKKIPARLAILSACHSGAGPLETSEGVQSFARAFTAAGVKTTLASNWEASDKATHDILLRFYEEVDQGQPLDVALQIATLAYLENTTPAFRSPSFWANLSLNGLTRPIPSGGRYPYSRIFILLGLLLVVLFYWFWLKGTN